MVEKVQEPGSQLQGLRRKRVKVRYCDFKKMAAKDKDFGGKTVGLCDHRVRTVWVHNLQPDTYTVTRAVVRQHELAHMMLFDLGISWPKPAEEMFCDLYAVLTAPRKALSDLEMFLRRLLQQGAKVGRAPWTGWWLVIRLAHAAKEDPKNPRWRDQARQINRYLRKR